MHKPIAAALLALLAQPLQAQYSAGREVTFTVRVENVSTASTLKLSNGTTAPAPTAPLLWTITDAGNPIFTAGVRDQKHGLQQLAEDGNPGVLADYITQQMKSVLRSGVVVVPLGDKSAGPITPGKAYEFTVAAAPGQRLSLAFMFGQSNDLFYGSGAKGIALFDAKGKPLTVDVTSQLSLWDAGTEVNEEPGLGPNQAPRQAAPGAGTKEHTVVAAVHDNFAYPRTTDVIRVTVASSAATAAR
ncbi:MAG: spondin domain-containing protein [Gemmatimonadota bacterium]